MKSLFRTLTALLLSHLLISSLFSQSPTPTPTPSPSPSPSPSPNQ
ncbi:MAG: hypothetical protein N2035_07490 [Chthoniobacterales bacterium]|nr:hypothetical protein [Chthoniobacterales bacterium]